MQLVVCPAGRVPVPYQATDHSCLSVTSWAYYKPRMLSSTKAFNKMLGLREAAARCQSHCKAQKLAPHSQHVLLPRPLCSSSIPAPSYIAAVNRARIWHYTELRRPGRPLSAIAEPTPQESREHSVESTAAARPDIQHDQEQPYFGLPLPAERHQRPMDFKAIKQLRTASNTAAKEKKLMYIQAGKEGVTQTFLSACMDILAKHEFVRVRLGEGSGLDRQVAADALERLLDSICVHQIGYTITLYRQKGLPRPSNCPFNNIQPMPVEEEPVQQPPPANEARNGKSKKAAKPKQPKEKLPPEFEVL